MSIHYFLQNNFSENPLLIQLSGTNLLQVYALPSLFIIFAPIFKAGKNNMISYLQIEKLTKSFGDLVLFENITFGISQGQK